MLRPIILVCRLVGPRNGSGAKDSATGGGHSGRQRAGREESAAIGQSPELLQELDAVQQRHLIMAGTVEEQDFCVPDRKRLVSECKIVVLLFMSTPDIESD